MTPVRWDRVKELVLEALEHPPAERPHFLDQTCKADAELRREVESFIGHAEAPGLLDDSSAPPGQRLIDAVIGVATLPDGTPAPAAPEGEGDRPERSPTLHPTRMGRYRLLRALGRGAMGTVYEAEDLQLGRRVALKLFTGRLAPGEAQRRFLREARAAAALDHPNVVIVHDSGIDQDLPYIVMELLAGEDLRSLLQRRPELTRKERLNIVREVCLGLAHCHARGVVHRDVKPPNIHVLPNGHAKLTDFGLAKSTLLADSLTDSGVLVGTPEYMAPEQIRGHPADARSDIFALGLVLYEALTGHRPFRAETLAAVLHNVLHAELPTFADLGLQPAAGLEAVIHHATDKDPDSRYRGVEELVADLDSVLAGRPPSVALGRLVGLRRVWSFARRYRRILAAAAVLAVLGALGLGLYHAGAGTEGRGAQTAPPQPTPAEVEAGPRRIAIRNPNDGNRWVVPFERDIATHYPAEPSRARHRFCDLTGDGRADLVLAVEYLADGKVPAGELILLRSDGSQLARIATERTLSYDGEPYSSAFVPTNLLCLHSPGDEPRVVALLVHRSYFPCLAWLIDGSGNLLREYVHNGHLHQAVLWDIDGDGSDEIVLGGTNNVESRPVLVVFDPKEFGGIQDPRFEIASDPPGLHAGLPRYYIGLPTLGDLQKSVRARVDQLAFDGTALVAEVNQADPVQYRATLTRGLESVTLDMGDTSSRAYARERAKRPSLPTRAEYIEELRHAVQFWDGTAWVPAVTPVRPARP